MATADSKETRERLLDAAEKLFGEQGINRVSLRDITGAAGANVAAVNYHFGSREGLLREVFARRMGPLNDERLRLLDLAAVAAGDAPPPLEDVLRSFVGPTFSLCSVHPDFMRFMARMHLEPIAHMQTFLHTARFPELIERMRTAMIRALPDLPVSECWWGVFFLVGAMIHTWSKGPEIEAMSGGEAVYESDEKMVDRLVSFAAAGLRAWERRP